jgi:hypothetical protein
MKRSWVQLLCALCLVGVATSASAQTSILTGLVVDTGGGVVPGATIAAKNNATAVEMRAVTNTSGAFSIPSIPFGTYTVTATLSGFKTNITKDVVIIAGSPADIRITMEVGTIEQSVEVVARSELVQTTSTAVSSTISAVQIQNLPMTSRNALFGFVVMLPGVDTPDGVARNSTLFGLPEQSINITIDGVNTQNNFQRSSDGFYSMVFPQLDAIEQVTVTGAAAGAESAQGGSTAIKFVTRSGTNQYRGAGYYYFRHPAFNTNYYFNEVSGLGKNRIILNQFGGSVGGPIKLPGLDGTGKAFFFVNYEEFYQPTSATRTRQVLNTRTADGFFRYTTGGGSVLNEVNVMALAAANGHSSSFDPTVLALIGEIRRLAEATVPAGTGVITDQNNVNLQQLIYQPPGTYYNHLPTTRVDFNLSAANRLSGSYWWQEINRYPDIQNSGEALFPGLPNVANYTSVRSVGSVTLRSTMGSNLVNELVGGWQWSPGTFNSGITRDQFTNQDYYTVPFPLGATSPTRSTNPNTRYQTNVDIRNTLNWQKGAHTLSFGGGFTRVLQHNDSTQVVPGVGFGIQQGLDPADTMFNTTNFPGASNDNLNNARALYAFLNGRVTSVNGTSRLNEDTNQYEYLGVLNERGFMDEWNAFIQDSWRFKPTVTVNAGLAYVVQLPLSAGNGVFSTIDYPGFCGLYGINANGQCNLWQVGGPQTGVAPTFTEYSKATKGYNTDWNNVAPNVGVAWRPNVQGGIGRAILGDPEQATFRAGFAVTFNKAGFDEFTGIYGSNPGRTYNTNRNNGTGSEFLLVGPGETWPVLFRDKARLGPPANIPVSPAYPIAATTGSSISLFDPFLEVAYARTFSFGFQRAVSRDMAFEVRYVGTRGFKNGTSENWNETNVIENHFFDEFKLAQNNLRQHVLSGCGQAGAAACSFAYRGEGTNTSPLPTYLAYLVGLPSSQSGIAGSYSGTAWTNSTLLGRFATYSPDVVGSAGDLQTTARIANAALAGLPSNFFRMNPTIGTNSATLRVGEGENKYDSIVLQLRRRLSRGMLFDVNYTRAWRSANTLDTLHRDRLWVDGGGVPHALKTTLNWDIPVGRGRRYGTDMNAWMNGALGGWSYNLTGRVQSGQQLTSTGRILVGMTEEQLRKEFKIRVVEENGVTTVYNLPDDIILNTQRAHSTSATSANGYSSLGAPEGRYIARESSATCVALIVGDCSGDRNMWVEGPVRARFDMSAKKMFPLGNRASFIFEIHVFNVANSIQFVPTFNPGAGDDIFQVDEAFQDISGNYDPGGRLMQLVWRINW